MFHSHSHSHPHPPPGPSHHAHPPQHPPFDPLPALTHLITHSSQKMELCAISNGGWETWLQVELWLLLRQHYPPSSGWTISREKRVYTDQLQRCDILVSRTNPTQASHEKHIIELKAEVSSDIDHQSGRSALRARVGREVDKFHGVAGGWRPATGWVVGVGGIAPAGNALANVQENWVRVGTPLEGFWGQEVGVFWTKVGL